MNSAIEVRAEGSGRDQIPSRYTTRHCTGFRHGGARGGLQALFNLAALCAGRKVRACVIACRVRRGLEQAVTNNRHKCQPPDFILPGQPSNFGVC